MRQCKRAGNVATVIFTFLICVTFGCHASGYREEVHRVGGLEIEIAIPKDRYSLDESVDADIVFRNNGNKLLKFAMIDGPQKMIFFDFLLLGNMGREYITNNGEDWLNPGGKNVRMIPLDPGKDYKIHVKNVLPFRIFGDLGVHPQEHFELRAIYRDHTYGHPAVYEEYGKEDPSVWKGIVISKPVIIRSIFRVDEDGSQ